MQLQDSTIAVLSEAGFEIRKWISSNPALVERLPANFQEMTDGMTNKSDDKNFGRQAEPKSRPLQFHSKIGQKDTIFKTRKTVGSHQAL